MHYKKIKCFFIFLIICGFLIPHGLSAQDNKKEIQNKKKYSFSEDWFSNNIPTWEKILSRFKGKPNIRYLEIGVFEGRSVIWMLENILTHNSARITCVDPLPGNLKIKFFTNLEKSGFAYKVKTIIGYSQIELKNLHSNSFDIIYIDGSHTAYDVLADAVFCWPLLKNDGILIFDDYLWLQDLPVELRPKLAVDAFITAYRNFLEVIHREYQMIVKKQTISDKYMFPIYQYVYSWRKRELFHKDTMELIELTEKEKELIERLIKSRKFGEINFSPDKEILNDEDFIMLLKKLNLNLNPGKK